MREGQEIEVHTRFDDSWCEGFEIAEVTADGVRVRRKSDGALLPGVTSRADVRPAAGHGSPLTPPAP